MASISKMSKPSVQAPTTIITRDVDKISAKASNIYEAIVVIGKRARQLSAAQKEELNQKLSEFASSVDNLEEIHENREQIEISRYYERQPKATAVALEEFMADKFSFYYPEEN